MYKVTLRRVRATIVAEENNKCYILRYAACNTHALCCHLWPAQIYHIFPHYLIKGTIKKKATEHKMRVLIFSAVLNETFLIIKRTERRNGQKLVLMYSACYSCPLFMKLEFSRQIFEKYPKNLIKIPVVGAEYFHADGRTDGQT